MKKMVGEIPISTISVLAEKTEHSKDIIFIHMSENIPSILGTKVKPPEGY